jgi:phospholipase C
VQQRWGLPALTARDAAAPGFGDVLTLAAPRTDDVLAGVTIPVASSANPAAAAPSHLQEVQADLISRRFPAGRHDDANSLPRQHSNAAYTAYISRHSTTEL